jgi:proteasome beta subunit
MIEKRAQGSINYSGTTTIGLVCSEGVVLAADTRVTAGLFIAHRRGKKIHMIDDHVGVTIAGQVADAQNVVDVLKFHANWYKLERGVPIPVRAAARLVSNVFFSSRLFPYIAEVLVGGYDAEGPSVYNLDFLGSITSEKFVSTGSGSPVAYGVLEKNYRENMGLEEATRLALTALAMAIRRNAGTGDSFDIVQITRNGYVELDEGQKQALLKETGLVLA